MESDGSSGNSDVAFEAPNFVRVYKDGRIERFMGTDVVPASVDPATGVSSKDVVIDHAAGVSARLYLPPLVATADEKKLPVLVYFHGGGFIIESAFSPTYHNYLNAVVARVQVVAVSVDYRRAPEYPLPAAYDDSWAALQWVASHAAAATGGGAGVEPWLVEHGDFGRVFLAGDSAGANIAHNLAMRAGADGGLGVGGGVGIAGIVLTHPYFWGEAPVGAETPNPAFRAAVEGMWKVASPASVRGVDDPCLNPTAEGAASLARLGCGRVLVCVAEKDFLKEWGRHYYEALRGSGWGGVAELLESEGEDHVFHLLKPSCEKAAEKMERLANFLNH